MGSTVKRKTIIEGIDTKYPVLEALREAKVNTKTNLEKLVDKDYKFSIFGDIFLEDLKKFREDKLEELKLKGVFPLWKMDSNIVIEEFLKLGFKAITVSVNAQLLDESFVGRVIDEQFIKDLPLKC